MKPQNRSQYYRLRRIVEMVREGPASGDGPSSTDFCLELGVSRRTVARDLDYLRDEENAPLAYDATARCWRLTEPTYELPPIRLRAEEVFEFFVARKILEAFQGTPMELGMQSVMGKIAESLQGFVTVDLESLTDRFSVIAEDRARIDPRVWRTVVQGIHGCQQLAAVYQRFDGQVKDYRLEPHHLVGYHGNWYVLATNTRNGRTETFALSRFRSVAPNGERFERPAGYDAREVIRDGFGISRGEEPMAVRLRFSAKVATYIKERLWHPSQTIRDRPDGSVDLALTTTGRQELVRWILSWTPEVRVLAPVDLRQRVMERLQAGVAR
ncbi:MAG TPA: WYL domain-containing protein [Candidatus Paceibacterota bacterium]|nr:WYL domain-containing protein [Kiritimatiellia bacterium]HOX03496.1 WYL domain-containing protein [Verrucomicrobiota bacterium]HRZ46370.1 WYL domain-containing protein [Candidatus Paceibacterota bacterium]HSA00274.1 WYL domain-containing protein [Candidatus Paceibacterota bacterium]